MTTRTSKTSKVQSPSKTAFVLALPADLSVGEVVKKAKAAGMTLSPNYVSNIRSSAKAATKNSSGKSKAPKAAAAAKVGAAPKAPAREPDQAAAMPASVAPTLTITEFIKSQPRNIPAADVVAAARKAGLTIDTNYVYKVRSRLAGKAAPKAIAAAPKVGAKPPAAKAPERAAAPKATKPAPTPKPAETAPTPKAAKAAPAAPTAPKSTSVSSDVAFKKLVVELGVARAEALLAEVKKKLAELFAGA